ncbi:MAG: phosphate/phosphite/phosphonate ABC transporter substrate-binding protein [Alphaproteobacteria bacterium]|nr:phosphate/phosphite/phosphonate ABC transporter substrate-binding protein [Alphaproteobacteria bacterium]
MGISAVANARMYSVAPGAAAAWRALLAWVMARAGLDWPVIDHDVSEPITDLWARPDLGCVMMCGLPFSLRAPQPTLIAAPIPSPERYGGRPIYFTDIVVRADAPYQRIEDTFGARVAYTVHHSQSGFVALRRYLLQYRAGDRPLYREAVGPLFTPRRIMQTIASGDADVGPLDSFCHDLLRLHEPELAKRVRTIATTPPTPIPALVATADLDNATLGRLRAALVEAEHVPDLSAVRAAALLKSFDVPDPARYDVLRRQAPEAELHHGIW